MTIGGNRINIVITIDYTLELPLASLSFRVSSAVPSRSIDELPRLINGRNTLYAPTSSGFGGGSFPACDRSTIGTLLVGIIEEGHRRRIIISIGDRVANRKASARAIIAGELDIIDFEIYEPRNSCGSRRNPSLFPRAPLATGVGFQWD